MEKLLKPGVCVSLHHEGDKEFLVDSTAGEDRANLPPRSPKLTQEFLDTYPDWPTTVAFMGRLEIEREELLALAAFVIDHPFAANGMGDRAHSQWMKMQEMARVAIAKATSAKNSG